METRNIFIFRLNIFRVVHLRPFFIVWVPGVDNDIADSLPRLCRNNMIDSPKEYSPEYILSALHIESYEPSSSKYTKIGKMHNSIVGHFGLERTLKHFKDKKDTWEYQRQHIRYYIDHCPCCQKMNMLKIPIHAHDFITSITHQWNVST